jgi:creatinine amidohydrolase
MTLEREEVRAERMQPRQLRAALARRSLAFLPLGSLEWHAEHLPIGLDGLTAHGVCVRAAARAGGIVLPALYIGTGGGHTSYPWTIMMDDERAIVATLTTSLRRLQSFGVKQAVLYTGHFSDEQLEMIRSLSQDWSSQDRTMEVLALGINMASTARVPPDHAGVFETSVLIALHAGLVDISALPAIDGAPSLDPGGNVTGPQRHQTDHPLYGVFGPDPRAADYADADDLLEDLVAWLVKQVDP